MPVSVRSIATAILLSILPHASSSSLRDVTPSCSHSCLDSFILSNFPTNICPDPQEINCLCTRRSTSGLTIGEGALGCVISYCPNAKGIGSQVYGVCGGVLNAIPNTHSTIIATVLAEKDPNVPVTSKAGLATTPNSIASIHNTMSTGIATMTSSAAVGTNHPTDSAATSGSEPIPPGVTNLAQQTVAPSTTPASSSGSPVNKQAIVAVSVGGGVVVLFLIGVILFIIIRRRRQRFLDDDDDDDDDDDSDEGDLFEIGGAMSEPPPVSFIPSGVQERKPVMMPTGSRNEPGVRQITSRQNIRDSGIPATTPATAPNRIAVHNTRVGVATTTASSRPLRIVSQLLPAKPTYGGRGEPHPITQRLGLRPESSETVFEEDLESQKPAVSVALNLRVGNGRSVEDGTGRSPEFGLPSNPRAAMPKYQRNQQRRQNWPPPRVEQPTEASLQRGTEGADWDNITRARSPPAQYQGGDPVPLIRHDQPPSSDHPNFGQVRNDADCVNNGSDFSSLHRRRRDSISSITSIESLESGEELDVCTSPEPDNAKRVPVANPTDAPHQYGYFNASVSAPLKRTGMRRSASVRRQGGNIGPTVPPPAYNSSSPSQNPLPGDLRQLPQRTANGTPKPSRRYLAAATSPQPSLPSESSTSLQRLHSQASPSPPKVIPYFGTPVPNISGNYDFLSKRRSGAVAQGDPRGAKKDEASRQSGDSSRSFWGSKLTPTRRGSDLFLSVG